MDEDYVQIPENRPLKTLASISTTEEFKSYSDMILVAETFFNHVFKNEYDESIEVLVKYLDDHNDDKLSLAFCFHLIFQVFYYLPKHRTYFLPTIAFNNEDDVCNHPYSSFPPSKNDLIVNKMEKINKDWIIRNNLQNDDFYNFYERNVKKYPIASFIEQDNLQELKNFIGSNQITFDEEEEEELFPPSYVLQKGAWFNVDHLNLLDYCALFGSVNCFNFLKLNNAPLSAATVDFAILGGDFQIIHQLETDSESFDYHFYTSIMSHHMDISEWLLSNYKCEFFSPAISILFGDYRAFLFLLLNGADVSKKYLPDKNIVRKYSSLEILCSLRFCKSDVIKFFIEKGCEVIQFPYHSPISILLDNHYSLDEDLLIYLLEHKKQPIFPEEEEEHNENEEEEEKREKKPYIKESELYSYYSDFPSLKIIELLIKYGLNPNEGEKSPLEPLIKSIIESDDEEEEQENMDIIEYLLEHGADPNYGSEKLSVFHEGNVSSKLLKLLLKYGYDKQLAVFDVCKCNNPSLELIKHLSDLGVDFNFELETFYHNYESPLSLLCSSKVLNIDAIKYLILEKGVQINYEQSSPLLSICENNVNIEIIKLLLERDANLTFKRTMGDWSLTPLYGLCMNKDLNEEAIKLLLSYGADPDCLCESFDEVGFCYQENILCALCKNDNINFDIIKTFLHLKKDQNNGNQNPIYFIIRRKPINYDLIKLLIDNGVDINKTSYLDYYEEGFTINGSPLSIYCYLENDIDLEVIKFLIDNKADVNQVAIVHNEEFSPLYSLSNKENVNTDAINLLISNNAKSIHEEVLFYN